MAKVPWNSDTTKIDGKEVKNKWKWSWLEEVVDGIKLGEVIEKIDKAGFAFCKTCQKEVNYKSRGVVRLKTHVEGDKHKELVRIQRTNCRIPGQQKVFGIFNQVKAASQAGSPSASTSAPAASTADTVQPLTPLCDRICNHEAMVLAYAAENSVSFSEVPKLISLVKALASDKQALDQLSMERTTASYKMTHGLARTFKDALLKDLKENKFSLNIDEATSSNNQRVVAVMVSYFNPNQQKVVIHHLESFSVIKVDSESLFDAIDSLFTRHDLPWTNLMSILMDSCAVMRGSKKGLETLIRTRRAPHMLDIDGDTCHHAHNATKKFCKPFDNHVENLMSDLHSDFKWSADQREALQLICSVLGIKYTNPERYISHRWLSVYDTSVDTVRLFDAYTIFYSYFLPSNDSATYKDVVEDTLRRHSVNDANQKGLDKLMAPIVKKNMTSDGKARKLRIVEKVFFNRTKTCLILQLYTAVLCKQLKKYVVLFQSKESKVDKLHDEQMDLAIGFLANFVKPQALQGITSKKLADFNPADEENHLPLKDMFIGSKTRGILSKYGKDKTVTQFLHKVKEAYVACSISLLSKMPLNKDILKCMSALGPSARQHSATQRYLNKFPELVSNILEEDELDGFDEEVRAYTTDTRLPGPLACSDEKLDVWWARTAQTGRYPLLTRMVKAVLSCFHGPMVEGCFSIMGEVLDESCASMKMETVSAIQTVKHELLAKGTTSVGMFFQKTPKHANVDHLLCKNLRSAYRRSEERKEQSQAEDQKRHLSLGIVPSQKTPTSKRKFREDLENETAEAWTQFGITQEAKRKK